MFAQIWAQRSALEDTRASLWQHQHRKPAFLPCCPVRQPRPLIISPCRLVFVAAGLSRRAQAAWRSGKAGMSPPGPEKGPAPPPAEAALAPSIMIEEIEKYDQVEGGRKVGGVFSGGRAYYLVTLCDVTIHQGKEKLPCKRGTRTLCQTKM